ncbi:MAG: DUF1501 domain-containing protein, partial [Actinomycetota bacterium]|nr:DUF1501 domain-containing protein [Actinomycetota bacterium]
MTDSTRSVLASLSSPAPTDLRPLSRRYFLQATAAGSSTDGVLVVVTMAGGNDSINTVVPINDSAYVSRRSGLAIPFASTLALDAARGLHPSLPTVKAQWDLGNVAVIEGVGHPSPDLSHFTSMARVMQGSASGGVPTPGWLGRAGDLLGGTDNPFVGVHFGASVPLVMAGQSSQAIAVPERPSGLFRSTTSSVDQRQQQALARIGGSATGLGVMGDELARRGAEAFVVANDLAGSYAAATPAGRLAQPMTLAARFVNANLGVRVVRLLYGDFDHHAEQAAEHADRLAEFDAGLAAFLAALAPAHHRRTVVLTT